MDGSNRTNSFNFNLYYQLKFNSPYQSMDVDEDKKDLKRNRTEKNDSPRKRTKFERENDLVNNFTTVEIESPTKKRAREEIEISEVPSPSKMKKTNIVKASAAVSSPLEALSPDTIIQIFFKHLKSNLFQLNLISKRIAEIFNSFPFYQAILLEKKILKKIEISMGASPIENALVYKKIELLKLQFDLRFNCVGVTLSQINNIQMVQTKIKSLDKLGRQVTYLAAKRIVLGESQETVDVKSLDLKKSSADKVDLLKDGKLLGNTDFLRSLKEDPKKITADLLKFIMQKKCNEAVSVIYELLLDEKSHDTVKFALTKLDPALLDAFFQLNWHNAWIIIKEIGEKEGADTDKLEQIFFNSLVSAIQQAFQDNFSSLSKEEVFEYLRNIIYSAYFADLFFDQESVSFDHHKQIFYQILDCIFLLGGEKAIEITNDMIDEFHSDSIIIAVSMIFARFHRFKELRVFIEKAREGNTEYVGDAQLEHSSGLSLALCDFVEQVDEKVPLDFVKAIKSYHAASHENKLFILFLNSLIPLVNNQTLLRWLNHESIQEEARLEAFSILSCSPCFEQNILSKKIISYLPENLIDEADSLKEYSEYLKIIGQSDLYAMMNLIFKGFSKKNSTALFEMLSLQQKEALLSLLCDIIQNSPLPSIRVDGADYLVNLLENAFLIEKLDSIYKAETDLEVVYIRDSLLKILFDKKLFKAMEDLLLKTEEIIPNRLLFSHLEHIQMFRKGKKEIENKIFF